MIILAQWSGLDFQEERLTRNGAVHDGSVVSDIILISTFLAQDSDRVKRWKTTSETSYGILFRLLQPIVRDLQEKLRIVLNRCAGVLKMASWSKKADHGDKIKDRADRCNQFRHV